jgi:hypothetical protein
VILAVLLGTAGLPKQAGAELVEGVHFDFAQGVAGPIEDVDHRLSLSESDRGGGTVLQLEHDTDWAVHFPGRCSVPPRSCPRAILESGSADFLNPGRRAVSWGASVLMMPNETSDGGNILQKGLSLTGTQYKLQVDGEQGRPSCVIAGMGHTYMALSWSEIADSQWHQVTCVRQKDLLSTYVDGQRKSDVVVPSDLSIWNDSPLRLGGKGHGPYNDQFHGSVDDVFVEIG